MSLTIGHPRPSNDLAAQLQSNLDGGVWSCWETGNFLKVVAFLNAISIKLTAPQADILAGIDRQKGNSTEYQKSIKVKKIFGQSFEIEMVLTSEFVGTDTKVTVTFGKIEKYEHGDGKENQLFDELVEDIDQNISLAGKYESIDELYDLTFIDPSRTGGGKRFELGGTPNSSGLLKSAGRKLHRTPSLETTAAWQYLIATSSAMIIEPDDDDMQRIHQILSLKGGGAHPIYGGHILPHEVNHESGYTIAKLTVGAPGNDGEANDSHFEALSQEVVRYANGLWLPLELHRDEESKIENWIIWDLFRRGGNA